MINSTIQPILKNWTGYDDLQTIEVNVLEQLVSQNEYSPSLQFLLAKKYELIHSPLAKNQLLKTVSYFPSLIQLQACFAIETPETNSHPMDAKLNTILSDQLAQFQAPVSAGADLLSIETLKLQKDYFEAQGIEIDLSTVAQDKFTKQLRSFTAWLKVLKNKDGSPVETELGDEQEKAITAIAEKANTVEEIITEAMAEIWEKQGNPKRAIAVYSKLSFIFPEKSVYFATRIQQLKLRK